MSCMEHLPFPRVVRIEPSGACNLKCLHCPTGTVHMSRGIMKDETFDMILNDLMTHAEQIKVVVLYHGGEPLLNKNFSQMCAKIKALGIPFVKTVSNGMSLDDIIIKEIVTSGLDEIEVSLDGVSIEQNDSLRRGCQFKSVSENIHKLINYRNEIGSDKPKVFISSTQFLDIKSNKLLPMNQATPGYLLNEFEYAYSRGQIDFKTTLAMVWPHIEIDHDVFDVLDVRDVLEEKNFCDHIENTITIRWNGDIVACCYDLTGKLVMGSIYEDSLINIWNNDAYQTLRKAIHEKRYISVCQNCNTVRPNKYLTLRQFN